jgi:hypothetical protein
MESRGSKVNVCVCVRVRARVCALEPYCNEKKKYLKNHIMQLPSTKNRILVLYPNQGQRTVQSHSSTSRFNGLFIFSPVSFALVENIIVRFCTAPAQTAKPILQLTARLANNCGRFLKVAESYSMLSVSICSVIGIRRV